MQARQDDYLLGATLFATSASSYCMRNCGELQVSACWTCEWWKQVGLITAWQFTGCETVDMDPSAHSCSGPALYLAVGFANSVECSTAKPDSQALGNAPGEHSKRSERRMDPGFRYRYRQLLTGSWRLHHLDTGSNTVANVPSPYERTTLEDFGS